MGRYRLSDEVHTDIAELWAYVARDDIIVRVVSGYRDLAALFDDDDHHSG